MEPFRIGSNYRKSIFLNPSVLSNRLFSFRKTAVVNLKKVFYILNPILLNINTFKGWLANRQQHDPKLCRNVTNFGSSNTSIKFAKLYLAQINGYLLMQMAEFVENPLPMTPGPIRAVINKKQISLSTKSAEIRRLIKGRKSGAY